MEQGALSWRGGDRAVVLRTVAALACVLVLAGCQSDKRAARATGVWQGDTLHGRIAPGAPHQEFAFEGVASSMVDFTLQADSGNQAAPQVQVLDPEGQPLDVGAATTSDPGDRTLSVERLILPKTGAYRLIARPCRPGEQVYYTFRHEMRYAPMPDTRAELTETPRPVRVSAPRGGLVAFTITPDSDSRLVPDVVGVTDPWGGPALDRSQVPEGCNPPRVSHGADRSMTLTFVAPRPGVYTILAAAKRGGHGIGTMHVDVRRPRWPAREIYHDGSAAGAYGFPGGCASSQTVAGLPALPVMPVTPLTSGAPVAPPMPAPPSAAAPMAPAPAAGASAITPPCPPIDPPIAQR